MISKIKNMKKYRYIIGFCVLLTGLVIFFACEDRLDKPPLGDTEETFFTTQDNYESAVLGMYAGLTYWYWYNNNNCIHMLWLLPGDDMTTKQEWPFESFNAITPDDYRINYYWDMTYAINTRANIILEKVEQAAEGVYLDADLKNWHRGEALFIRALCSFKLFSWFGAAPVITARVTGLGEQTKPPSSTGTQLLDQAITDLTEAATLLPDNWEDKYIGRATSNAAYGLLGKCLVTRACYGGGNADYSDAIEAFNNISSDVQLTPQFYSNFDAYNENNEESLFEFQASEAPGFDNIWLSNDFGSIGSMLGFFGYFNNVWSWWGNPCFVPTDKLLNAFETGDPRIDETFRSNADAVFNGWEFIKYTNHDSQNWEGCSHNNNRILRYGDILLLRAEAYLQTGNAAAALADVNSIRERARNSVPEGNPPSAVPADLATVTMQDIMDERLRELAGEEERFVDLKRWHAAGYVNLGNWSAADWGPSLNASFDFAGWFAATQGDMMFPIPTDEVDLNPNITQNKGY